MLNTLYSASPGVAAFLDVDGTLLQIAARPDLVVVPPLLVEALFNLWMRLDGALALISGRSLEDLDRLFAPYRFPAAGVHGCELREPSGCVVLPDVDKKIIERLHEDAGLLEFDAPGVLIEYKSFGVAVHYRLSPEAEPQVAACVRTLLAGWNGEFALQRGKCVYEIKLAGFSKGSAIRALMGGQPFLGRHPLYIGDDLTDESAFEAINTLGGTSARVGDAGEGSLAKHRLKDPTEVHELLRSLLVQLQTDPGGAVV